jgi:hypothetical protein
MGGYTFWSHPVTLKPFDFARDAIPAINVPHIPNI